MPTLAFDHAVIVVPDLEVGARTMAAAGFVVVPGGLHDAIPTANALVAFGDGSYLELLAPRDAEASESLRVRAARPGWRTELHRGPAIGRRFLPRLVGPAGVADFVVRGERLERMADELRRAGVALTGPVAMSRERKDGVRLAWRLMLPADDRLPFFIEDDTPRALRVPGEAAATTHPNGARGVSEIGVRVASVAEAALLYADRFDAHPTHDAAGRTTFAFAGVRVVLSPGTPEGACQVTLRGARDLPEAVRALGVRGEP